MKYFVLAILLISSTICIDAQNTDSPKHPLDISESEKAHYEFMQEDLKSFRTFVEEERKEHRTFLEDSYKISAGILAILLFFLGWFGWSSFTGVKSATSQFEKNAKDKIDLANQSLKSYIEQFDITKSRLKDLDASFEQYVNYYRDANPKNGRFLIVGKEDRLNDFKEKVMPVFAKVFNILEFTNSSFLSSNDYEFAIYDTFIYLASIEENGEDTFLLSFLARINLISPKRPLVVYTDGKFIQGETKNKLNDYLLYHMANNLVSLIDNTSSAYRVSKLMYRNT